jgi:RNA recognition motif-containing protein
MVMRWVIYEGILQNLVLDQETGLSKGFAFVEMPDENEAKAADESLNLSTVAKSKIRVKFAQN